MPEAGWMAPSRVRGRSPPPLRMLRPEVSKGKTLMIPVFNNPPPSRSNNFAGRHKIRYYPNRSILEAFKFEGTVMPENLELLAPQLEELLVGFSTYIILACHIVHSSGAIGPCRDCYTCQSVLPEMGIAIQPKGDFHTKGLVFRERVFIPALISALGSCGGHWNASWVETLIYPLGDICWMLESEFHQERRLWEPLIQAFAKMSIKEITIEMLSEKRLQEESERILEKVYKGEVDGLLLYALEEDTPKDYLNWESEASESSALDADDERDSVIA